MKLPLIALTAGVVTCSALQAAVVVFSPSVTLADDGSNLSNAGTLLTAVSFISSVTQTNPSWKVNLNGINFVPVAQSANASRTYFTTNSASTWDLDRASGRPSTAAIYPLIYNTAITSSDTTPFNLTLQSLTVGVQYQIQFVFSSQNTDNTDRSLFVYTPSLDTSYTIYYGVLSGPQLLTATFTADNTTQSFLISGDTGNRPQLAGFVLSVVPEPSSLALLSLAAVTAGAATRKRFCRRKR